MSDAPASAHAILAAASAQMGMELPGNVQRLAVTVDLANHIRAIALELGRLLARTNLFMQAGYLVTVDLETGKVQPMNTLRFIGWVEQYCAFKHHGNRQRTSLTREESAQILEQDIFRDCLRPLDGVNLIRLPVRRPDGTIEFLSAGYDEQSLTLTVDTLPYRMDLPVNEARDWYNGSHKGYPWATPESEAAPDLNGNPNYARHLAACVGVYCKLFFPPGTPRPMMAYLANQPGTGKSTLVGVALIPVYGTATSADAMKDEKAMSDCLATTARNMKPYLFLDDIGHSIYSNPLNRFITAMAHGGRVMGGNTEFFEVPNVTQVFVTGNEIKTSRDLSRRALICELFLAGDVRGRTFEQRINSRWLAEPEVRAKFLAALCAFVRHYAEMQAAHTLAGRPIKHEAPLETFEEWSETTSLIVQAAGYCDPLTPTEMLAGGSEEDDELRAFLVRLATDLEQNETFSRGELVEKAREWEMLSDLVGIKGDDEPDKKDQKRFGRQFQRVRGREFFDSRGRKFVFSHRRKTSGASYPVTFPGLAKPSTETDAAGKYDDLIES